MMKKKSLEDTIVLWTTPVILAILGFSCSYSNSESDEESQQRHYCEMVEIWNSNKDIPENDRPGWPPYDGEEQCK